MVKFARESKQLFRRSVAFVSWCLCVLTFVNVNHIVPALLFDNKARPQDKLVSPYVLYVVRPE